MEDKVLYTKDGIKCKFRHGIDFIQAQNSGFYFLENPVEVAAKQIKKEAENKKEVKDVPPAQETDMDIPPQETSAEKKRRERKAAKELANKKEAEGLVALDNMIDGTTDENISTEIDVSEKEEADQK